MSDHAELAKLNEHELKSAIRSAWKKHEVGGETGPGPRCCTTSANNSALRALAMTSPTPTEDSLHG